MWLSLKFGELHNYLRLNSQQPVTTLCGWAVRLACNNLNLTSACMGGVWYPKSGHLPYSHAYIHIYIQTHRSPTSILINFLPHACMTLSLCCCSILYNNQLPASQWGSATNRSSITVVSLHCLQCRIFLSRPYIHYPQPYVFNVRLAGLDTWTSVAVWSLPRLILDSRLNQESIEFNWA